MQHQSNRSLQQNFSHKSKLHQKSGGCLEEISFTDICAGALLGKGSFGTVLRAVWYSPEGDKDVAIKYFESEKEQEQFNIEKKQLARVNHPNIIQMYGACLRPHVFLVMEFAECGSLYKVIHENKVRSFCF